MAVAQAIFAVGTCQSIDDGAAGTNAETDFAADVGLAAFDTLDRLPDPYSSSHTEREASQDRCICTNLGRDLSVVRRLLLWTLKGDVNKTMLLVTTNVLGIRPRALMGPKTQLFHSTSSGGENSD